MSKRDKNLIRVGQCIKSIFDNWDVYCRCESDNALSDIEVDLETALADLRAYRRHVAHVAIYGNQEDFKFAGHGKTKLRS